MEMQSVPNSPSGQRRDTKMLLEKPDVGDLFNIHSLLDDGLCSQQQCIDRNARHGGETAGKAPWSQRLLLGV